MLLGRLARVAQCLIVATSVSSFSVFRQRTTTSLRRRIYYMSSSMEPSIQTAVVTVLSNEESIEKRLDQVFAAIEEHSTAAAQPAQEDDCSLSQASIRTANQLRTIASTVGGRQARQALERASQDLLRPSASTTTPASSYVAFSATAVALALSVETTGVEDPVEAKAYRSSSRAAASAMSFTLQRHTKQDQIPELIPASNILRSLLRVCSSLDAKDDGVTVDWHIVTMMARAFQLDGKDDQDVTLAVATIANTALCLDSPDSTIPEKIQAAGTLALVAQLKPWTLLKPVVTILPAVRLDLWEAAERICASAASDDHGAASEAVQALIQEALDARNFRQADKLATKFYECGGQVPYLEARYLHACDTVAKVIRKGAIPVIERQVERVDKAVIRVVKDGIVPSSTAGDDIRDFAMRQLEETGDIQAAHRLAEEWGLDYVHDEEALKAAAMARKEKYLQWEDVLSGSPPDLISNPETLVSAFEKMTKDQSLFGFDVEWSEDSAGAEILQVSTCLIAILIDLPALSKTPEGTQALTQTIGRIFADSGKVVVGFGCKQDLSKLRSTRCKGGNHWLSGTSAVVDAQPLAEQKEECKRTLGLSRVCEKYLGKPLDKSEQCSVWSARPLSLRQRTYASLDAWACAALYEKLCPSLKRPLE